MSEEQWGDDIIDFSQPPIGASSVRQLKSYESNIYAVEMNVITSIN